MFANVVFNRPIAPLTYEIPHNVLQSFEVRTLIGRRVAVTLRDCHRDHLQDF
jgi:hypothetical protein